MQYIHIYICIQYVYIICIMCGFSWHGKPMETQQHHVVQKHPFTPNESTFIITLNPYWITPLSLMVKSFHYYPINPVDSCFVAEACLWWLAVHPRSLSSLWFEVEAILFVQSAEGLFGHRDSPNRDMYFNHLEISGGCLFLLASGWCTHFYHRPTWLVQHD